MATFNPRPAAPLTIGYNDMLPDLDPRNGGTPPRPKLTLEYNTGLPDLEAPQASISPSSASFYPTASFRSVPAPIQSRAQMPQSQSGISSYKGADTLTDILSIGGAKAGGALGGPVGEFAGAAAGNIAGNLIEGLFASADKRKQEKAIREEIRRREAQKAKEDAYARAVDGYTRNQNAQQQFRSDKDAFYQMARQRVLDRESRAQQFTSALNQAAQARSQNMDALVSRGYM